MRKRYAWQFDYTTALKQLCQSNNYSGVLRAMLGVTSLIRGKNSVSFKFKGSRKANALLIEYDDANDLYNMVFFRGSSEVKRFDGCFADDLKSFFEKFTGLYLSF